MNKKVTASAATKEIEDKTSADDLPEEGNMSLLDHLIEFRTRMLKAVALWVVLIVVCFFFSKDILNFLLEPYYYILENDEAIRNSNIRPRAIATALYEILFTQIKAAVFLGTILASPVLLYQVWKFIAPGLYQNERKAFWPFLIASPFLFILGGALVYYILMPFAWRFFLSLQQIGEAGQINIEIEAKISEYFNLVMRLILAFGFCFQLPVAASLMGKAGLISSEGMRKVRKYAILSVFVVAAVVTPPDPISQLSLAIPIILLYELSIFLVQMIERGREDDEYYDDEDEEDDDDLDDDEDDDENDKAS